MTKPEALEILQAMKQHLDRQQYRTLAGQINNNDADGAMRGLRKILKREGLDAESVKSVCGEPESCDEERRDNWS